MDSFSRSAWAGDLAAQGFAAELTDAIEFIPVVTGRELIISRPVFTRLVSHHCPRQEDRREQANDGEQTRVAWTLAAAIGRPFIHMHDPHSLKSLEAGFDAPTIFHSRFDPRQFHHNFTSCLLILHERSKYAARRGCNDLDPAQMTEP
jgi:hypothetical protein